MSRYQLLPALSEDEYAALREDIRSAGVRVPIDVDEQGNILDGHHRKAIADELGIECPERIIRDLPEFAKVDYALSVNLARRHLDQDGKRKLVRASLKRDSRLADREHARRCGVSHPFVAGLREALEASGQLETVTSRIGADGRERQLPTQTAAADRVDTAAASPEPVAAAPGPAVVDAAAGATGAGPAPVVDTTNSSHAPGFSGEEAESAGNASAEEQPGTRHGSSSTAAEAVPPAASAAPEWPCEKCGGEMPQDVYDAGFTRCADCDPDGEHQICRPCGRPL